MPRSLLSDTLGLEDDQALIFYCLRQHEQFELYYNKLNKQQKIKLQGADDTRPFITYLMTLLSRKISIKSLTSDQLETLMCQSTIAPNMSEALYISSTLQINDLNPYDTIITHDGLYQVSLDTKPTKIADKNVLINGANDELKTQTTRHLSLNQSILKQTRELITYIEDLLTRDKYREAQNLTALKTSLAQIDLQNENAFTSISSIISTYRNTTKVEQDELDLKTKITDLWNSLTRKNEVQTCIDTLHLTIRILQNQNTTPETITIEEYNSSNEDILKMINSAIADKPKCAALGHDTSYLCTYLQDFITAFNTPILEELATRKTSNNLITRALKLDTDAEIINYSMLLEASEPNKKTSSKISLRQFNNNELEKIIVECDAWDPQMSHRILYYPQMPDSLEEISELNIGDTLIIPNEGVIQLEKNEAHLTFSVRRILTHQQAEPLQRYIRSQLEELTKITSIDLTNNLNKLIIKHKKGRYLLPEKAKDSKTLPILNLLKTRAQEELTLRQKNTETSSPTEKPGWHRGKYLKKTQTFFSKSSVRVAPAPGPDTKKSLTLAQEDISEEQASLNEVADNLMGIASSLSHKDQEHVYEQYFSDDKSKVKIIATKTDEEPVLMLDADTSMVTIYPPLINNKNITREDKATMFLTALGIPPLNGRDTLDIQGGDPKIAKIIQDKFSKLKREEEQEAQTNLRPSPASE